MQTGIFRWFNPVGHKRRRLLTVVTGVLGTLGVVLATPPLGFVVNQIVAMGSISDGFGQHVQIARNADGDNEPWQLQLQAQGSTDFYVQRLVLAPAGYSGWHTHPGILFGTVVSGSIDFFDENCQKRSITAGQVFLENNRVHAISNPGSVNVELTIAYLVKHGAARRIEASAPTCAPSTPIP